MPTSQQTGDFVKLKRDAALAAAVVAFGGLFAAGATNNPIKHVAVAPPPTPQIDLKLADNAKEVPTSTEIAARVTDGEIETVTLTDAKGAKVDGAMRSDGSAWVPGKPLKNNQTYTAHITARNDEGGKATATRTFTTMAKPSQRTETTLYLHNGATYGVAMPVTVAFDPLVPKEARAAVQHRLFVTTDPPQPGVWSWIDDGSQVYYRAPDFWKPGTKISVRSALQGVPMGKGRYGDADHVAAATVAKDKVTMAVDNKTKRMSVFKNDTLIRKLPVSLGKPSTPTSSGKMVIMEKFDQTVFDTTGSADPYVVTVQDAQRLTWGGEFIHSAPWSVGEQGSMNVSHGCTNVSPEDADWLMKISHIGDLVEFTGTEAKLAPGNGWTAWNQSWHQYIKGSALPVPEALKSLPDQAPSATPPAATGHPPQAIEAKPSPTKGGR
jgi:lipoprotein-anchoring transpeptidase ErfK/SrfK